MKIIDLLNKIANGEEVPKKIKFNGFIWNYDIYNKRYCKGENLLFNVLGHYKGIILNDEVEILEEEKKDNFTGWKMYQDGKEVCSMDYSEEEKKIPEKLKIEREISTDNPYIKNKYGTKCYLTKHSKIFADKINEILDYLKSKGDE